MLKADAAFVHAVSVSNKAELAGLLDPEFTWISATGRVTARAQVLEQAPHPLFAAAKDSETRAFTYGELGDVQADLGRGHVVRVWAKRSSGWKILAYQELMALEAAPSFTPGAGKECENPCKKIAFRPKSETEREVAAAYSKLETAAHARSSAAFGPMVGDEFIAASSYGNKLQTKRSRMAAFDQSKDGGVAPTPLISAKMLTFGDAVLMLSEHKPDRGNPLRVARIWVKRNGSWVETLSYQTAVASDHDSH